MASEPREFRLTLAVAVALTGLGLALFGVYWDDAWHTDRGRDDFLSPPHLSLYVGVALVVGVVIWWTRRSGGRASASGPVGLAVAGAVFTLASAPVDEWWHQSFGRDAVLWSPPHLAAVAGTVALGAGVALVASAHRIGGGRALVGAAAGAGVIGAWQVLVLEYDTDVAQFSSLWYLPVMATGLAAAGVTVQAAGWRRVRWPATWAGVVYTVAMIGVILVLKWTGFSTSIVPLVVPALLVADLGRRLRWALPLRASLFVVALFAGYWPYLGAVPGGVQPTLAEAAVGAGIAVAAVAGVLLVMDPAVGIPLRSGPAIAVMALTIGVAVSTVGLPHAEAHDPGQGDEIAEVTLVAEVTDRVITVEAVLADGTATGEPIRVVARRGGRTLTGPLAATAGGWAGRVDVDQDGRWFVYVEARRGEQHLEAWIPVIAGSPGVGSKDTALYAADTDGGVEAPQMMAGVLLVSVVAALLARIAGEVRATLTAADALADTS